MPKRGNKFEDFDPNASDPEDLDFNDAPSSSRPRSRKSQSQKKRKSQFRETPQKKRRRRNYGTDSDIVDDEEDLSEDEFSQSSAEEPEPERNPATGRAVRRATKKAITYEESEEEDEKAFVDETAESEEEVPITSKKDKDTKRATLLKPSLIVKFRFSDSERLVSSGTRASSLVPQTTRRSTRSRTASRPPTANSGPMTGTRKSSRISREPEANLVALSSSGRRAIPASTDTPDSEEEAEGRRRTRGMKSTVGAKQPRKMPSMVAEESHSYHTEVSGEKVEEQEERRLEVIASVELHAEDEDASEGAAVVEVPQITEEHDEEEDEEDEEDDAPPVRGGRLRQMKAQAQIAEQPSAKRKRGADEGSEFDPEDAKGSDGENMSEEDVRPVAKRTRQATSSSQSQSQSQPSGRRSRRNLRSARESSRSGSEDLDLDELREEAGDLGRPSRSRRQTQKAQTFNNEGITYGDEGMRRRGKRVDYTQPSYQEVVAADERMMEALSEGDAGPSKKNKRQKKPKNSMRLLHTSRGMFGGFGQGPPLVHRELDDIAKAGDDPESSDDDEETLAQQLRTPAAHDAAGGPAEFGKINKQMKAAGADTDPLGVDESVKFDAVGGLDGHIDALKEMVLHPLMYPEIIGKFGVQPPRGVLFHGPPGTGKTLLARALSNSIESEGRKVTFFMRKGADALSKWVGEAERQLRLLFEEAQKCQPSIIFFDEIDGLAPVRSSKTEQIHASIVATLLALMDGMDNRGQVVVIGATNRPDNVDPALRRPGRFDREFYFPLPDKIARRAIIDINTKGWEPALAGSFKDQLAELTTGYGGADIRALCTEAALNAIQGTYPQIYKSNKKLAIDPARIKVLAKDFMLSINKIVPSSARSNMSRIEPLPKDVEPLLRIPLDAVTRIIDNILPRRKKLTALQEAEFDDRDDEGGFERETLQRAIDKQKIFRPRLLIRGLRGNGQQELAAALLHKLEGLFVQNFDMATLMEDPSRSPEAAVIQLFKEVRRQKPSIVFIPEVDVWYDTMGPNTIAVFKQELNKVGANDPVLVLGMMSTDTLDEKPSPAMLRDLFGFSKRSNYELGRPDRDARFEYFKSLTQLIRKRPTEFPDPSNRKRRKLEELPEVKESPKQQRANEKAKRRQLYKEERNALNLLKIDIQRVMDYIKTKYKVFNGTQVSLRYYEYLFDDADQNLITSDLTEEQRQALQDRPFIKDKDDKGREVLKEVATGRYFYNMDLQDIEERLAHGYYRRWKDFLSDIRTLYHDAHQIAEEDCDETQSKRRKLSQELVNNVEVDMWSFERDRQALHQQLLVIYKRHVDELRQARAGEMEDIQRDHPIGTTTNSAPILARPPAGKPRNDMHPPVTPMRGVLSNGDSGHHTNGSTVPSRPQDADGDTAMANDTPVRPGAMQPPTNQTYSQRSGMEKMAPGSQLDEYHNSAPTTTSQENSKRSSDASGKSARQGMQILHSNILPPPGHTNTLPPGHSGHSAHTAHTPAGYPTGYVPTNAGNASTAPAFAAAQAQGQRSSQNGSGSQPTSHSNSNGTYPNFQSAKDWGNAESVPDTQPYDLPNSGPRSANGTDTPSSTQPLGIANLLNPSTTAAAPAASAAPSAQHSSAPSAEQTQHILHAHDSDVTAFHASLAQETSGMSVEQCVQVNAALLRSVIDTRGEWDKAVVLDRLRAALREVLDEVRDGQVCFDRSLDVEP